MSVSSRISVSPGRPTARSLAARSLAAHWLAAPLLVAVSLAALAAPALAQDARLPNPGMAWVIFGADTVVAEVAGTPEQREKGLMDRDAVPDGTGMLFVFRRSEERYLWMRNTYVPLDAAFFDDDNRIGVIRQMEPLDETLVDSEIATRLVLEVRQGWFAEKGIEVGAEAEVVFGPGIVVR